MSGNATNTEQLAELGQQLRVDSARCADAAGSGHPTSSMSGADLMAVLLANHLRFDFESPDNPAADHLIFSKGHASPLLYSMFTAAGAITDEELLTFRENGSRLEGHPTPRLPWVDVATGSLGQGLPAGVGIALAGQWLEGAPSRVWVLCGDSELAEGAMWESFEHAADCGLDNLTAIVDVNRLGQRGPTRHGWDLTAYARRISAYGWHTIEVDGHDVEQVDHAYAEAEATHGRPTVILARTQKGSGVTAVENEEGKHGKPLPDLDEAIRELGGRRSIRVQPLKPEPMAQRPHSHSRAVPMPTYEVGAEVATRTAFGETMQALGQARADVVVLDGEVADSTRSQYFASEYPDRFFECYIAEQQMLAAAVGMQVRGWVPYVATFAAFLSRAYDFVRMAAVSRANVRLVGSHSGVAIGKDGPSQMGLEDLAMFRAVCGSTVLYPCDANQSAALVSTMADREGISYLRTNRGETPVIYGADDTFPIGGSRVLRSSSADELTIVAAGVTLHEALAAADELGAAGINARVIDLYSVKPVDTAMLRAAADETGVLLTVEDHWQQGGLGDAVLDGLADGETSARTRKLAVSEMPVSATPAEQLQQAGIDRTAIVDAARGLVRG